MHTRPALISARMSLSERSTQTRIRARTTPTARRGPGPPGGPGPFLSSSSCYFNSYSPGSARTTRPALPGGPALLRCRLLRRLPLGVPDGHRLPQPSTARAPQKPSRTEPLGGLHGERSGAEHVALGTTYDGALHQVPLPTAWTTKATLGDELGATTRGTPSPNRTPQLPHPAAASRPHGRVPHHSGRTLRSTPRGSLLRAPAPQKRQMHRRAAMG